VKNLQRYYELIDRGCPNYKIYEYYIWWPKEVYIYQLIKEKFGIELTRNQITSYIRTMRKQKGDPVGSP